MTRRNSMEKGFEYMGNNTYKIIGTVFMIVAAILYTIERCVANISHAIIKAGYASNGTNPDLKLDYPGFFENFFVWFFLFIGFILLAYGFPKR